MHLTFVDIFVLVSGTFSILATLPLGYLAWRSYKDGQDLREIQVALHDLAKEEKEVVDEIQEVQEDIHERQVKVAHHVSETKDKIEEVADSSRGA